MRILIVEDNERLAESIRDILKHRYDCQICNDGETGACLLKDGNFDGAILVWAKFNARLDASS